MSTNCIRCVTAQRTGPDLLCDLCRAQKPNIGKLRQLSKTRELDQILVFGTPCSEVLEWACAEIDRLRAALAAMTAERDRAKSIITAYELDYERVVVRGEKCAMELAEERAVKAEAERDRLRVEVEHAAMRLPEEEQ